MPAQDAGEQTDGQRKRFCKQSQELHRRQDDHDGFRHSGYGHDLFPIFFGTAHLHDDKSEKGQRQRERGIARHIGSEGEERDQPQQVGKENEKEQREQIRSVASIELFAHIGTDHLIAQVHHQGLEHPGDPPGHFVHILFPAVETPHRQKDGKQENHYHGEGHHILGKGHVERFTVGDVPLRIVSKVRSVSRRGIRSVIDRLVVHHKTTSCTFHHDLSAVIVVKCRGEKHTHHALPDSGTATACPSTSAMWNECASLTCAMIKDCWSNSSSAACCDAARAEKHDKSTAITTGSILLFLEIRIFFLLASAAARRFF